MKGQCWLLLATLLLLVPSTQVSGQYLKYATLSWRQISEDPTPITGGITVAFTLHTAWKREFFNRNAAQEPWGGCRTCTGFGATTADCGDADAPCVLANVGDLVEIYDSVDISTASIPQVSTVFSFGGPPEDSLNGRRDAADIKKFTPVCRQTPAENGRKCIPGRVIESYPNVTGAEIMPAMDALSTVYVVTELVYKYPSVTRTYSASFQGCCRMKAGDRLLNNNAVGAWDIRATVSVTASRQVLETGTAASPYFAFVPTVNVIKGRPKQFQVFAYDTADRPITYAIGTADEQGVGLNLASQGPYVSQGQYDNVMGVTIDAGTGMVTFPATASTVYERFYSLVITASVIGPCASYNFEATPPICLDELGTSVLTSIKTAVDFYIQVVNTGFVGLWPANDCLASTAGLPAGSRKCNEFPLISAPATLQRFLCGETNNFKVFASDGDSPTGQPTVSNPPGAFAIRHRVRVALPTFYNASYGPGFPRGESDCCVKQYAGKNSTDGTLLTASGVFQWAPLCERLEDDRLYSYQGRHRLDQYAACFTAVDAGGSSQWNGQLASPPACVSIAVLRCTKPTIRMVFSSGQSSTNGSSFVVPVATGVAFGLQAEDDRQTRVLGIYHRGDPGIPSTGATWGDPACLANSSVQISCNPVSRNFSFSAGLEHAGIRYPICFEATNDQVECPAFRPDSAPAPYGTFVGTGIEESQASQPLCITIIVPGPIIEWIAPTPDQDGTLTTYMGCLFAITLIAQDSSNYFDIDIVPFANEFGLPSGVNLEARQCENIGGVAPLRVAEGVGSCPRATRIVRWSPSRAQTGLVSRVCFNAQAKSVHISSRCFSVLVSKCRYCAQAGESLQAIGESFSTDWLQLWGANAHLHNPHRLAEFQLINLGALYPAHLGDSLQSLAKRFLSDVDATLAVNPDFDSVDQELTEGQPVCILPGICRTAEYRPSRAN